MADNISDRAFHDTLTRRSFVRRAGAAGVAALGATWWSPARAATPTPSANTPLQHVVISCQENRSFDHYFGYAPEVCRPPVSVLPRGILSPMRMGILTSRSSSRASRPATLPTP